MKDNSSVSRAGAQPLRRGRTLGPWLAIALGLGLVCGHSTAASQTPALLSRAARGLSYQHEEIPDGPWSIHIIKFERNNPDFEIHSSLAMGGGFGLATLSEQIRALPGQIGRPVAGINGDYYRRQDPYLGDPKGLQIMRGELISAPCDWSCFWVDGEGQPHITNVTARFEVTWPSGERMRFGLNEERPRNGAVLYTPAVGSRTETYGGRELILERNGTNTWLPLRAGAIYSARVRQVRDSGDSPVPKDGMVLSLSRPMAQRIPPVAAGAVLQISTATSPDLKDVTTAIGGGPALVRDGSVIEGDYSRVRHPRAALGWNKDSFFLVEVDGRQRGVSVGMTMREFSRYLAKLGCTDAINLDGGGSATCWLYGQVMNSPSEGDERGMGNAVVVTYKGK